MLGTAGALLLGGVLLLQTKTFAAPGGGPLVQYSFEDASNLGKDSSSAGNNATNNGITQTLGKVGKAAYFNANTAFLDLSAHASKLNLTEGTVSFWAKADSDAADFSSVLSWWVAPADASSFDGGYISLGNMTAGYPDELLSFVNGYKVWGGNWQVFAKVTRPDSFYKDGKWHAYTITMDSAKNLWLYIDGIPQTIHDNWQNLIPFFLSHNNGKVFIWRSTTEHHQAMGAGMKWAIDEFKIYNYARTAAQIKADYEQEANPVSPEAKLVAQYSFEDANNLWKDSSSAGNHATNNGVTQTLGRVGKAGFFDGQADWMKVERSSTLSMTWNATFSAWVKPMGTTQYDSTIIFAWVSNYYFSLCNSGKTLCSLWYQRMNPTYHTASPDLPLNKWSHVSAVWNPESVTFYINGEKKAEYPSQYKNHNWWYTFLNIGWWETWNNLDRYFTGAIDELKIYNYVRTAEQIKADYEQEAKPSLIIHYEDENGEQLIPPTMHTTNPWGSTFQLNQTYTVNPAKLNEPTLKARFDTPDSQNVTFTDADRVKEVTFVYKRPRLVLHYTFDEGGTTVADSSQLETKNPGTVIGTPTRSERGRVGGMYTDTAMQTQRGLWIWNSAAFTIAGWIKTDDDWRYKYFITNTADAHGYRFGIDWGSPAFLLGTYHWGRRFTAENCGSTNLAGNRWHHLVWVFDVKGRKVTCYVDGVKDGERALPDYYNNRWDDPAWIGGKNRSMATFRERWSIDDVRVYNYALSPQAVKELYDSFPAEETAVPVELTLTTTSPRNTLIVWEKVVASANLDLNRGGKNLKLVITVPKTLQPESNSISLLNGETVTSGNVNMVELSDKRVYTYYLKDNIKGQIRSDFSVFFPWGVTDHQTLGKITAEIVKGDVSLVNKELTFTAWAPFRLSMHWIHYTKPGNNYKVKYALNVYTETYFPWESPANFRFIDSKNPALYNFIATIPLPSKAKYIGSSVNNWHWSPELSMTYDAGKHAIIFRGNPRMFTLWNNRQMIELEYSALQGGEVITAAPMTFTGYLASPTGRIYTGSLNWLNQTVEAENANISLGFHVPQWSLVNDQDRQELFGLWIQNGGNTKVKNASAEFSVPEWIEVDGVRLPNAQETDWNGGETFWPHTVNFDYWTNKGKSASINGGYGVWYDKNMLQLGSGEFITKFRFKFPEMSPWEIIGHMNGMYGLGIRTYGTVRHIKKNWVPITSDTHLVMTGLFKAEGLPDQAFGPANIVVSMTSRSPFIVDTYSTNGKNFTHGQKIKLHTLMHTDGGWHYGNGLFVPNPSLFIMLPPGFELDTQTFSAYMRPTWTVSKPRNVTKEVVNPPKDFTVWRVDVNAGMYKWLPNFNADYEIKVTDSVAPGSYSLSDNIFGASNNPKYQLAYAWARGVKPDTYWLFWSVTNYPIIRWGGEPSIITATELGNGVCSKTSVDTLWCKGSFNPEELDTIYNYKSGGTGLLQTTLWNAGATVNNYTYTFRIPNVNTTNTDGTKNEWKPTIKSVEILGATGATYTETQEAHATLLKITIPTFAATDRPIINVVFQAPTFDDDQAYKNTYIDTFYTVGGVQKPGRTVGFRLVPSGFKPTLDWEYKFCQMAKNKNLAQGVSVDECQALLDFYRESSSTNVLWKNSNGWRLGSDRNQNRKWYNETVPPICSWYGISCQNNKLIWLNLSNNNLQKIFTGSFVKLKNLEVLNLSENPNFNAEFKSEFKTSLTNLKEINLSYTNTNNLNNLPASLEKLVAQKLTLTEFPFTHLVNLKDIDLSHGVLSGVSNIKPLFDRPKLEKLIVHDAKLRGSIPASLPATATIKEINLRNNQLTGKLPTWVENLTSQPVKIDFAENYITGPFPDWDANFRPGTQIKFEKNYIDALFSEGNYKRFKKKFGNLDSSFAQFKLVATNWGNRVFTEIKDMKSDPKVRIIVKKQLLTSVDGGDVRPFNDRLGLRAVQQPGSHINVQKRSQFGFDVSLTHGFVSTLNIQTELWNEPMLSVKLIPAKDFQDENDPNKLQDPNNPDSKVLTWKTMFGTGLTFELKGKYLAQYFSAVHYSLWGNDIGGGFFWREVEDLETPVTISANGTGNVECYGRVKGFYYSSQRGERLWPLDGESQEQLKQLNPTYAHLAMQWGRYTRCQGNENNIYGKITHTYKDKSYDLIAGVSYNVAENKVTTPPALRCNFQRLNNAIPFGYIYDSAGGIGILGASIKSNVMKRATDWDADAYRDIHLFHKGYLGQLENWKCVSDIFDHDGQNPRYNDGSIPDYNSDKLDRLLDFGFGSAQTTLFKLGIRGIIWLSSELSNNSRGSIEGNQAGTSLLLNTDNSIAGVINLARQRAEELCRNKWKEVPGTEQNLNNRAGQVLCYDGRNIDRNSRILRVKGYDKVAALIVKNADVFLPNYQETQNNAAITNLFIDKGDLFLLDEARNGSGLQKFDQNGYQTQDLSNPWISYGNFLRGNFIVNGLIIGMKSDARQFAPIKNKLVIHGKVASYNTYTTPDDNKKQVIKNILESDSEREVEEGKLKFIGLDQVFKWSCNSATGTGSDGTPCIGTDKGSSFITNKAFSLIDMDLSSPLFQ